MTHQGAHLVDAGALAKARAALDARLRVELERRLTLCVLRPAARVNAPDAPDAPDVTFATFQAEIATYQEARLLTIGVAGAPESSPAHTMEARIEAALHEALRMGADAILIWQGAQTTRLGADDAEEAHWLRGALAVAERLNLFDAATLALLGPSVTRAQARALGYEDGYALTAPLADAVYAMLARLTHEALARAASRRQGSSPPCYL